MIPNLFFHCQCPTKTKFQHKWPFSVGVKVGTELGSEQLHCREERKVVPTHQFEDAGLKLERPREMKTEGPRLLKRPISKSQWLLGTGEAIAVRKWLLIIYRNLSNDKQIECSFTKVDQSLTVNKKRNFCRWNVSIWTRK